ncbi:MAG: zinc metalloprotease [Hirschia sp.]|nr:zinc metalloprotease [Hirschia sp.]MBF19505.1 zinc metalloprotease [Hirschia sp.]
MKKLIAATSLFALVAACATAPEIAAEDAELEVPASSADTPIVDPMKADTVSREIVTTMSSDFGEYGLDLASMDDTVAPGEDFFKHVNGKWLDTFEIPADRSRYGAFTMLAEMSEQRVRNIIADLAAKSPAPDTLEGKIAAYYNAYMDEAAIEAAGLAQIQPMLDKIAAVETREDLAELFSSVGYNSPFAGWVDVDSKAPDTYIFYINQSGLGLGDRDYYLKDTDKNLDIRGKYLTFLTFMLNEAGIEDADAMAGRVYGLEKEMAKAHWDRAAGRNRNLTYNKLTREQLVKKTTFPVQQMLDNMGLGEQNAFIVRQVTPTADEIAENGLDAEQVDLVSGGGVFRLIELANTYDIDVWKAWLTVNLLSDHADVLPANIDEANFDFFGKTLYGQEEQRERWKRAVSAVEGSLGEGVGKVYAAEYFPPENKAAMDELVENLRKAMAANLDEIDWMGEATKVEARDKLAKFTPKIGYTEKFETYDDLVISQDEGALANQLAANQWAWDDMISQLGQPIDKTEWFMLPQTVNAYYSPNRNEIVFPAAILQPPFFNISADPAVNYGAIGGVIGHEMGHGFDDQGAKSDGDGVLRNWWTPEDEANFKAKTEALVAQYNGFCPLDDGETCVNGALTLGENIGDVGGLSMAYRAYKMSLNGEEAPVIDGLTGDQRFFLSWAQVWRNKAREEYLRRQLNTDPHSPADYRVNGVVRNFDEWYEAFNITEDDPLYLPPEKRIRIW